MTWQRASGVLTALIVAAILASSWLASEETAAPAGREEVIFWHFWGGADRGTVEEVVRRFNDGQDRYWVRAIAMPGNNLDLKVFLSVTGGDPPDLINQDDPIIADWASRGVLAPLDELAGEAEIARLESWLVPAAKQLGSHRGRLFGLCNGLDVRALFYNQAILEQYGLEPPSTLAELDHIARTTTVLDEAGYPHRFGYLPDPRRLWAWGIVFGGQFYDQRTQSLTLDDPAVVSALRWMTTYRDRYGPDRVAAFRQGDQSLPGKTFPLLAGRYTMVMDGQWRVRDLEAAAAADGSTPRFGVCALPPPPQGRRDAGWVNGNFFIVPRHARCPRGAWEFMKFWSGFGGHESEAARTCVAGGWIPVSAEVIREPTFQAFLDRQPLFREFVRLAQSPHQVPTPPIPGAALLYREVNRTAADVMFRDSPDDAETVLKRLDRQLERQLHVREDAPDAN